MANFALCYRFDERPMRTDGLVDVGMNVIFTDTVTPSNNGEASVEVTVDPSVPAQMVNTMKAAIIAYGNSPGTWPSLTNAKISSVFGGW